jgi:hypothetical protein
MRELFVIATDRFNNDTWESSRKYREKKGLACIYAPPCRMSASIALNSLVFVIEMNNSTNKILGIGLIKNKIVTDKIYKVQDDTNYNRYIYIGKHHMSRELLEHCNPSLVSVLEQILFKGYKHSKRGAGITKLSEKALDQDICRDMDIKKAIRDVFVSHFREKSNKSKY